MYLAIIILPLLGSIASGFFGRKIGVSGARIIACTAVVTTTILAALAFFEVGLNNIAVFIEVFRWIDSESLNVSWGFHFDSLTVSMLILVLIVSSLVHIYSAGYMSHHSPKPHQFTSIGLKSSGLDFSNIASLIRRKKGMDIKMSELKLERSFQWKELKKANSTLYLSKHVDDSKNNAVKELKKDYPAFFDEDSENTTKEGLEQVVKYLGGEYNDLQSRILKLKTEIEGFENKIEKSKKLNENLGESSNVNSILIILMRPFAFFVYLGPWIKSALPYFSLLVTISSLLFISFIFPSLDVPCFIQSIVDYTKHLIKYEIAITLPLLLWSCYTYSKKISKYITIGKNIIHFIKTSYYIDIWVLLVIFTVIFLF